MNSTLTLYKSSELIIDLDPISTEERVPSVEFDIAVDWRMPFQNFTLNIKSSWFLYSSFESFIQSLDHLKAGTSDEANLRDMSDHTFLSVRKDTDEITLHIFAKDTAEMGHLHFKHGLYPIEIGEIQSNYKNYPKWW